MLILLIIILVFSHARYVTGASTGGVSVGARNAEIEIRLLKNGD